MAAVRKERRGTGHRKRHSPLPQNSTRHRSQCGLLLSKQGATLPSVDGEEAQLARGWRGERDGRRRRPPRRVSRKKRGGSKGKKGCRLR
jgi:hypothetical protein